MSISRRLVLKDNHPTAEKLSKLCALADELGISISFYGQRAIVEDRERDDKLPPLYMEDIEDNGGVSDFPPCTEFKLVYDNPAYLAQQERELEERRAKDKAEREAAEAKAKAAEEARKAKQAKELESKELAELDRLQKKYKGIK